MRRPGTVDRERGSAIPMAVGALGVLLIVGAALGVVAAMVAAHRQAQSAADLAALSAATAIQYQRDPCGAAASTADANDAALQSCRIDGEEVVVQVRVRGPRWLGQAGDLSAQARAGPVGVASGG
ncbi:MAG: flp pilus-assembly TadE/G-like family protein [Nocardioides sp.]|uniref:Rv3654c family TadE-like protein n=1 Tax=Nocardioides sp. TaxID=35761 RepID=UPI0039E2A67C